MLDAGRYDTDVSAEGILEKLLFGLRVRTAERLVPVRETTKPDDLITMADSVLEGCRVPEIHEQAHAFMLHFQVFGVLEGKIEEKPLDGQDVPVEAVLEGMLGQTASLVIVGEGWLIPIMGYSGLPFGG